MELDLHSTPPHMNPYFDKTHNLGVYLPHTNRWSTFKIIKSKDFLNTICKDVKFSTYELLKCYGSILKDSSCFMDGDIWVFFPSKSSQNDPITPHFYLICFVKMNFHVYKL